jgi:hypothetical protein
VGVALPRYSIDRDTNQLVLIQAATGAVFPVGPLDFATADLDLTRVDDSIFLLNSFLDVGVDLVELDRRTGATLSKKGQAALPTGTAAALAGATSATLQLTTSDAACFEAELGTVKKADGMLLKAKNP